MGVAPPAQVQSASLAAGPSEAVIRSRSAQVAVAPFEDPELLAGGHVSLVTLGSALEALGPRWSAKERQLQAHLEALLRDEFGAGSFARWSETDYLVRHEGWDLADAQVACLRSLRETLHQFVGLGARAAEGVFRVKAVAPDHVEVATVETSVLLQAEASQNIARQRAKAHARATAPFVASDGRTMAAGSRLDEVLELRAATPIGYRLTRQVRLAGTDAQLPPEAIAALAGVDVLRMDLANILDGLAKMRSGASIAPTLVVPVSLASMATQRGRAEIVAALMEATELVEYGVICELSDIEGAPPSTLEEAVRALAPLSLFVIGGLKPTRPVGLSRLRHVGFRALAFECPEDQTPDEFFGWAEARISAAKQVVSSVLLYEASSRYLSVGLVELGASHATLRTAG